MNKKTLSKILVIVAITFVCLLSIQNVSMAKSSEFLNPPAPQESSLIEPTRNTAGAILSIVQVIGVSVAIIMLIVLAIKYLSSAPNDRAEIKKHAVVYVVGAVVLFAATGILGIIKGFADAALPGIVSTTTSDSTSDGSYKVTEKYEDGRRKETWYDKDGNVKGWILYDKDGNEIERK